MKVKLRSTRSVLRCSRSKMHCFVTAPLGGILHNHILYLPLKTLTLLVLLIRMDFGIVFFTVHYLHILWLKAMNGSLGPDQIHRHLYSGNGTHILVLDLFLQQTEHKIVSGRKYLGDRM